MKNDSRAAEKYQKIVDRWNAANSLTPLEARFRWVAIAIQRISDGLGHYLQQFGTIIVGVLSLAPRPYNFLLGISGAVLILISSLLVRKRQALVTTLENRVIEVSTEKDRKAAALEAQLNTEIEALRAQLEAAHSTALREREAIGNVLTDAVKSVAVELSLWDDETRLSLYCHDNESHEFIRLARVSDNPALETTGRRSYPDDVGFIAQVWQNKAPFAPDLPKTRRRWVQYQQSQFGLDAETANNLSMHTKCMLGARIDYKGERIGLVIIESEETGRLTLDEDDKLKKSPLMNEAIPRLLFASQIALSSHPLKEVPEV